MNEYVTNGEKSFFLSKEEIDRTNPYEIYCSVEENDNPVVVEFTLKY